MKPYFKKFELITLRWGYNINCLDKDIYTKEEIKDFVAINYGSEFSDIDKNCNFSFHMGIVVSSYYFNKNSNTILVAPITSKTKKDKKQHLNKFFINKSDYKSLRNDSVILLNKIKEIDKNRVKSHIIFLMRKHRSELNERLRFLFEL